MTLQMITWVILLRSVWTQPTGMTLFQVHVHSSRMSASIESALKTIFDQLRGAISRADAPNLQEEVFSLQVEHSSVSSCLFILFFSTRLLAGRTGGGARHVWAEVAARRGHDHASRSEHTARGDGGRGTNQLRWFFFYLFIIIIFFYCYILIFFFIFLLLLYFITVW